MVEFLLKRRIAVLMTYLALVILGCITFLTLPVSLLPDVAIPHISVHLRGDNMSAREMENTMTAPLRRQLMQVGGLADIKSETRDGSGVIRLTMDYGVDTDLAFIEVNEKIDAAMNSLPHGAERPKTVKASATDLPVVYLNITARDNMDFLELSSLSSNIIARRLEQLPEVTMVDITGMPGSEVRLTPDMDKMRSAGVTIADIEKALGDNNVEPGSMTVRDGYYEYNIYLTNRLRSPEDVSEVPLMVNGRLLTIGDFCDAELAERRADGYSLYGDRRAVTMAIIKNEAASMDRMEKALDETLDYFSGLYPDVEFTKSRSQTSLLDFTISNLEQNLILGLILVFLLCALFMKSGRLPFVIGITVVVAVIITFLLFYLFGVSINIISLAGLILAVGMMIDNSVIVAENITQFRERGKTLRESCVLGTNEMITPMLSSSLTTVAVFVPLVFMSGIAGAIFADQAFAITAGLASSYIVGITLMPVLYDMMVPKIHKRRDNDPAKEGKKDFITRFYDHGIDFVFSHKWLSMAAIVAILLSIWPLAMALDTRRMPDIDTAETLVDIDWNQNINVDENLRRVTELTDFLGSLAEEHSAYAGSQDFMLDEGSDMSATESQIYLRASSPDMLPKLKERTEHFLRTRYPDASYSFNAPDNIFEKVFSSSEPPLEARFTLRAGGANNAVDRIEAIHDDLVKNTGADLLSIPLREQVNIIVDHTALLIYGVDYSEVSDALRKAFKGSQSATLRSFQEYLPVNVPSLGVNVEEVLDNTLVKARPGASGVAPEVPLKYLVRVEKGRDFKTITAGNAGEYVAFPFFIEDGEAETIMTKTRAVADAENDTDVTFTGSIFSNREMIGELTVILLVSLLMMYFILCAQFESFLQPLIVLLEIPLDVAFALLSLLICGETLNLMSAIGIIVTCGIVVNDSILKIDSINELRHQGTPILEAVHTAGRRRLKPIIMTSLTTILAMVPVLFTSDMGSELQRPLAIALIGSMIAGTLISIYLIPLIYYLTYRDRHETIKA